jgi:hypothetical protein
MWLRVVLASALMTISAIFFLVFTLWTIGSLLLSLAAAVSGCGFQEVWFLDAGWLCE